LSPLYSAGIAANVTLVTATFLGCKELTRWGCQYKFANPVDPQRERRLVSTLEPIT
jgi:hypothetical protein